MDLFEALSRYITSFRQPLSIHKNCTPLRIALPSVGRGAELLGLAPHP